MSAALWAVIPAAGRGRRMQSGPVAKQYFPLAGRPVIEHSLQRFLSHPGVRGIVVALAPDDDRWGRLALASDGRISTVTGGAERADSVLAALEFLQGHAASPDDWVLVHDAARPCLSTADLERLITSLMDDPVGGLLAVPSRDTLKRSVAGRVAETLDRREIWQAQTPQMFRLGLLYQAMLAARNSGIEITDEASAIEHSGRQPRLVEGRPDNLKITTSEDLKLAEAILMEQRAC